MSQAKKPTSHDLDLNRLAIWALSLLIFIPMLGIIFLFQDQLKENWLPLLMIFFISALGFYLFMMVIRSVLSILRGLEDVSQGKSDRVEFVQGPTQLREMTEIINSLNKLTHEFQENAAQLEHFIEQFTTLTEMTEITARIPDIRELLSLVLRKAMASTHARKGTVMLLEENGDRLEIVAAQGWTPENTEPIHTHESLCGKIVAEGAPLLVEDIGKADHLDRQNNPERYTSPSFLIMPLVTKTTTIGAVCLSEKSTGSSFSEHDKRFLTVMLGQIGYAVENARLLKQARSAAEQLQQAIQFKDLQLQDAQRQIIQAEKLSALGQLIAGVAHEINNPLTSVRGFAELLMMAAEGDLNHPDVQKKIRTIHDEANRATKIVQNLLSFAREKPPETRLVNLNDIVRSIVELRQYDLKTRGIELSTDLDPQLPGAMLDLDQIKQVILNLVNNSSQALAGRETQKIKVNTRQVDNHIELCVEDTGGGIPGDSIDRIFDPFFTTKQGKTNSGLGLSISYGIIRQHGGIIQAESVENVGTKMIIHLPVASQSEIKTAEKKNAEVIQGRSHANLKALIIDDEKPIVDLLKDLLKLSGFQVFPCFGGIEGKALLSQNEFDLIICDIRMPDLDGRQLYEQVTIANPALARRFIFTTGDTADPQTRKFTEAHNLQLVAKPFTHQDLMNAVLSITDQDSHKV